MLLQGLSRVSKKDPNLAMTPTHPDPKAETRTKENRRDWLMLTAFIVVTFGASFAATFSGSGNTEWYRSIAKPTWNPPSWIFGPVWTVLYFTIGIAGWLVWRKSGFRGARWALAIFGVQLVINAAWSPVFFGLGRPDLAFILILVLIAAILATMVAFRKHDRRAAWMLFPYLLWVSFATVLNYAIMMLNPR